jgi:hypothetical protein
MKMNVKNKMHLAVIKIVGCFSLCGLAARCCLFSLLWLWIVVFSALLMMWMECSLFFTSAPKKRVHIFLEAK